MNIHKENNEEVILLVDESYGENFCATCIVCIQGVNNRDLLLDQLRQLSIDPAFNAYNSSGLLHYNENNISTRQTLAPWISEMPISAYIAITQTNTSKTKQQQDIDTYHLLFPEILKPLLMKFKKRVGEDVEISLLFENLSDKLDNDLVFFKNIVSTIPDSKNIAVKVATKATEPLLFLPDYFLGFVYNYFSLKKKETWPTDSLKLLVGKVGLILIINNNKINRYKRGEEIVNLFS